MGPDEIAATLDDWSLTFVGNDSDEISRIPEKWRPIALSADAESRRRTALSLWNQSFLDLLPEFAEVLNAHCVDVRVCMTDDSPVLAYVLETDDGELVSWVGYDPGTFEEPDFWESFPEPVQVFLRQVHAGFASASTDSFGVARPMEMGTIAELADFPDGVPGWDDDARIPSTRLLQITTDGGILKYCLSPDIAVGKIALVYEGDIDPKDFGQELDELLMSRFEDPS
ncbi:hypothetical protein [Streptomyces halobius]|uniref:SUKH-3 immunity protein of toxin-antitoxin system n=1 Tax=Streptomyces halobius TaxID=2879846 RepID=A0ABY4MGG0_9ACTN|nr:hypothetical protein [Streptomyces halobius]UQA96891.1 hypothetical protein K9S39_37965 [Streptomyces halobius]